MRTRSRWFKAVTLTVLLFVSLVLTGCNLFKSDLEILNEDVKDLNSVIVETQSKINGFSGAESEAQKFRATIEDSSDGDIAILDIADSHLKSANTHYQNAQQLLSQAGTERAAYQKHTKAVEQEVDTARDKAKQASAEIQYAYDDLESVRQLMDEVDVEYIRTFIWFEMGDYWKSEMSEFSSGDACYYGEVYSTVDINGNVTETIVDEGGGLFGGDEKNKNWKTFSVEDYEYFVAQGIVQPMENSDPNREEVGKYLCGEKPQDGRYGALGEPEVTLVKERGALQLSQEDEDAMVGNERYGAWCSPDGSGQYNNIPEGDPVPQNAEWCWHMPENGDTRFYYIGFWNGSTWGYTQGPRRCYDCTSQSWSGNTLVPASQFSQATGLDAPSTRNPVNDGGPGSGK